MTTLIKNVRVIDSTAQVDVVTDVCIKSDAIRIGATGKERFSRIIDGKGLLLTPGFIDLHVHFREPGFTHKETIASGIARAFMGGFTSAVVMPNTNPSLDEPKQVALQHSRALKSGFDLMVAAAATKGLQGVHATDAHALKKAGAKALTDDGKAVMNEDILVHQMRACRRENLLFMQHAEDLCQSHGHPIHEGSSSQKLQLKGQPSCAEIDVVKRDIGYAEKLGVRYHVLHVSAKETIGLIRQAKKNGTKVSCEVTPHHLFFDDSDLRYGQTDFKMNPPLRDRASREALLQGICDGTVDAVATDHAPHAPKEKARGLHDAPFGVTGLETALPVMLSLVRHRQISLKRAIEVLTTGPARVLKQEERIGTFFGEKALRNAVLINPAVQTRIARRHLGGWSKNSPFLGMTLYGQIVATFCNGRLVFEQI